MKVAILIGFVYHECLREYLLPEGIIVDLYLAYTRATAMGTDRVVVVTDQPSDVSSRTLFSMVIEGKIDAGLTTFVDDLKHRHQLGIFHDYESFIESLKSVAKDATRLFFYYTGHATRGMALFPQYRHPATYYGSDGASVLRSVHQVSLDSLLETVIQQTSTGAEVMLVLDCCDGPHLPLAFESSPMGFVVKPRVLGSPEFDRVPYGNRSVICLAPWGSQFADQVSATSQGSDFSRTVFSTIKDKPRELYTNFSGTVLASHPNILRLWAWLTEPEFPGSVHYDHLTQTFKIKY